MSRVNNTASKYTDDEVTTFMPSRTVIPFPDRRAPADEPTSERRPSLKSAPISERRPSPRGEPIADRRPSPKSEPASGARRAPVRPEPAVAPPPPTKLAPFVVGPPPRARSLRGFASPGILVYAALGALGAIFALGMLVGRIAAPGTSHSAPIAVVSPASPASGHVAQPPSVAPEAPPAETREMAAAKADATAQERTKEQTFVALGSPKPPARRAAHGTKRSSDHGVAAASKRPVVAKQAGSPGPAASQPRTPAEADDTDDADDLSAASAADELARAQLEAVMK